MVLKEDIRKAWEEQQLYLAADKSLIRRKHFQNRKYAGQHIEVISGIRRCGKSTLLKQIIHERYDDIAYFNFEDSRIFGFDAMDFQKFDEIAGRGRQAYFFDEIQNISGWEIYIRQLHDRGEKVFITGSNASLLSRELGTRLTGRHIRHELFPFDYDEFLDFMNSIDNIDSFNTWTQKGGFPEYLASGLPEVAQNLVKDIVFRDVAVRYGIRNTRTLTDITLYLLSNTGKEISYNGIRKTFDVGSAGTVSDYLTWLNDSYLLFYLPRFSWSARSIAKNPRKVYGIDNGLISANSLSFSSDRGRLLENAVFLFLRQQTVSLFYFREKRECDFIVFEKRKCIMTIQVCEMLDHDNLVREREGLIEAMEYFGLEQGYIISRDQEDTLTYNNKKIIVIPARKFFRL